MNCTQPTLKRSIHLKWVISGESPGSLNVLHPLLNLMHKRNSHTRKEYDEFQEG